VSAVSVALARRTREEWCALLEAADVPFGPLQEPGEVAKDPQVRERELLTEIPAAGDKPAARHLRQPLRIDGHGPKPTRHAPDLGEHSVEILREAGYATAEIRSLREAGAVVTAVARENGRHAA
jgi:crotonobetainyl-CoA:carnitine CoA-transferase CaiB-like acyl-CoA transferase